MNWLRDRLFPIKATLLSKVAVRFSGRRPNRAPSGLDILLLALAWGNLGYAAGLSYLRHVGGHVVRSQGAILECGSGATTLLVAMLCRSTDRQFIVLEHNKTWHDHLQRILDYLGFSHVTLIHAPLVDYEGYRWYRIPRDLLIDKIALVVCDGPPSSNPGGRYGLLPTMIDHLAGDCTILMDDTHRRAEQHIIDAWTECRCVKASRIGRFGTHAEVVFC
ncbi:MAG: class I SAM-dependent methyltransferase [Candidatus Thiodiazotropha sp. (ex Ctena orbiculata)]|nr:class I SAM-dependent methyltransferase [Candidatus Thiodiazotropha taylori]